MAERNPRLSEVERAVIELRQDAVAVCEWCADACEACVEACEKHGADHCRACVEILAECTVACRAET